ncbi:MAG: radical SAM protein [Candidatus Peribacteraceae bacterium]|nr:radical SAM protein [Candidatus Peribacteraceae bacterium]
MKIIEKVVSDVDDAVKYVFDSVGLSFEVSYINKNKRSDDEAKSSSKHIICVSTHSGCVMGCKFCHLTGESTGMTQLAPSAIMDAIEIIYKEQIKGKEEKEILISFMGSGEPMMSTQVIISVMEMINENMTGQNIRFALATMLPDTSSSRLALFELAEEVKKNKYNLKIHLSLHFTVNDTRKEWMPNASDIRPSIAALEYYNKLTRNEVEIHYTLIDKVNDKLTDLNWLVNLLKGRDIPVKFLKFNPTDNSNFNPSDKSVFVWFRDYLYHHDIMSEYYEPNGADVGASCGQFKLEHYN